LKAGVGIGVSLFVHPYYAGWGFLKPEKWIFLTRQEGLGAPPPETPLPFLFQMALLCVVGVREGGTPEDPLAPA